MAHTGACMGKITRYQVWLGIYNPQVCSRSSSDLARPYRTDPNPFGIRTGQYATRTIDRTAVPKPE